MFKHDDSRSSSLYEVLQVPKNADTNEIKKAYHRFALRYHPDKNPGDVDAQRKFVEVSEAYQVLIDGARRDHYDMTGMTDESMSFAPAEDLFKNFFDDLADSGFFMFDEGAIEHLFEGPEIKIAISTFAHIPRTEYVMQHLHEATRGSRIAPVVDKVHEVIDRSKNYKKTPDINVTVTVTLEEMYTRILKKLTLQRIRLVSGQFVREGKPLLVPLFEPRVTFRSQGDELPDYDGVGDVIVDIRSKPHELFKRRKDHDLYFNKRISIGEMYTGCTFYFRHLSGQILKVSTKRAIEDRFIQKLRGYGLPKSRMSDERGDLFVKFVLDRNISQIQIDDIIKTYPPVRGEKGIIYDYDGADFSDPGLEAVLPEFDPETST